MNIGVGRHNGGFGTLRVQTLSALDPCETPIFRSDGYALGIRVAAPGEGCVAGVLGIARVATGRRFAAQWKSGDAETVGDVLTANKTGNGSVAIPGHGNIENHAPVAWQQVTFPGGPDDGIPAAHEKTVAGIGKGFWIV